MSEILKAIAGSIDKPLVIGDIEIVGIPRDGQNGGVEMELFRICYLKANQNIEARSLQREKDIIAKHYRQIGQKNPLDG